MVESPEEVKARLRASIEAIESEESSVPGEQSAEARRAFRKIERLACMREQASAALRQRLIREEFDEDAVDEALKRALACGLVDDQRYADVLVRSRLSQGKGRASIAAELANLGIDADEVGVFVESEGPGDDALEIERALAILKRKPPRSKNLREGAYRRLMQKGYGSSVSSSAARRFCEDHPLDQR